MIIFIQRQNIKMGESMGKLKGQSSNKNRILLIMVTISIVIAFAACADNIETVQTSANLQTSSVHTSTGEKDTSVPSDTGAAAEKQPSELYPAYIMEGPEKKWGYIDGEGKFIIKPQYASVTDFQSNGTAEVMENEKWGLIDQSGETIVKPQYSYISDFSENEIIATDDSRKSYLLDGNGSILFQTEGSIDKLSCGLAAFNKPAGKDKSIWGYINVEGKVIIEPEYEWAQEFTGDKAIVKISEGHFGIIDKAGKLLEEITNDYITNLSDDTFVFSRIDKVYGQKYGYMTVDGKVLLDAVYSNAEEFEGGLAIVNAAKDFGNEFGVINKKGEFIIPTKYGQIISLKNGIYSVPEALDNSFDINFMKKALFDKTGKQLTEFKYYDLERLDNGLISATGETNTVLLDGKGNVVNSIPKANGIGSIKPCGELYKVEADGQLCYLTKEGKIIWTSDNTIRFENGLEVKVKTFRPDRGMLIQYPEISGLSDSKVQEKINKMLTDKFVGNNKASNKDGESYTDSIEINFTADKDKDLLIISEGGYYYPLGAAHGQPTRAAYHIDLKTGNLYILKDLFKKDSGYKEKLSGIIKGKISKANKEFGDPIYSEDIGDLEENSGFEIKKDALQIYFAPYAIAAYAAGFPEFAVSYDELKDLINTEGAFWKSFDRDSSAVPENPENEITANDKAKIEEAVKNYENTLIEAINKNDFKLVEPWLYPESSLYTAQKKLVAGLNKKKIIEKLESYSVEKIEQDDSGMIYRVYVTENIGIQYPGKDNTVRQFNWVYSARYDYYNRQYQLTYIDKWEKK
jgi:hypothetical protein